MEKSGTKTSFISRKGIYGRFTIKTRTYLYMLVEETFEINSRPSLLFRISYRNSIERNPMIRPLGSGTYIISKPQTQRQEHVPGGGGMSVQERSGRTRVVDE